MYFAGISSATKELSVGVLSDNNGKATKAGTQALDSFSPVVDYTVVSKDRSKTENLIPLMKQVMEKAGLTPKDLAGLSVVIGPGSYSGLRGSVSAAKAMAQVLRIPLFGVSTLEAIAYNYSNCDGTVLVALDSVRDEFSVALFAASQGEIKRLTEDLVVTEKRLNELKKEIIGKMIYADDLVVRGANVAKIGLKLMKKGVKTNLLKINPKYSHTPHYDEVKKRS